MNGIGKYIYESLRNSKLYGLLQPIWRFFYNRRGRLLMRKHAVEMLSLVYDILKKNNVSVWLDFGTLLGQYRNNNFISHDCDLDLGVFYEDSNRVLELLHSNEDLKVTHEYWVDDTVAQISFLYHNLSLDICFYHKETDNTLSCYLCHFAQGLSKDNINSNTYKVAVAKCTVPYYGLETVVFKGTQVEIPINASEYLKANYGEDFMVPNKNFDYLKDAPNIFQYSLEEKVGLAKTF